MDGQVLHTTRCCKWWCGLYGDGDGRICDTAGAASVRVSNELGAGRPVAARLAAQSAAVLALSLMAFIAVLLALLHRVLPLIITSDPDVIDGTQRVVPIVAYMLIGDGVNAVLAGVVRGCGQQVKGMHCSLLTAIQQVHCVAFAAHPCQACTCSMSCCEPRLVI